MKLIPAFLKAIIRERMAKMFGKINARLPHSYWYRELHWTTVVRSSLKRSSWMRPTFSSSFFPALSLSPCRVRSIEQYLSRLRKKSSNWVLLARSYKKCNKIPSEILALAELGDWLSSCNHVVRHGRSSSSTSMGRSEEKAQSWKKLEKKHTTTTSASVTTAKGIFH